MSNRVLPSIFSVKQIFLKAFNSQRNKILTYSQLKQVKQYSTQKNNDNIKENKVSKNHNLTDAFDSKHKIFKDEDAPVIFDVTEEQEKISLQELQEYKEVHDPYANLNLKHGVTGVYNIEDLIDVLHHDNGKDIFVATVPKQYAYVDYIVLVTGRSKKHMDALAHLVRKVYKMKMYKYEQPVPKIEGQQSNEWLALDLGNIALHIFSSSARTKYDLETLWTVGSEYDDETVKRSDVLDVVEQYKSFLAEFQPNDQHNQQIPNNSKFNESQKEM